MTDYPKFKITNSSPFTRDTKIELNGEDISAWVCRYWVGASVKSETTVMLELYAGSVEMDVPVHRRLMKVSPELETLLKERGWTPPESGPA